MVLITMTNTSVRVASQAKLHAARELLMAMKSRGTCAATTCTHTCINTRERTVMRCGTRGRLLAVV